MLLDFGIAKLVDPVASGLGTANPTDAASSIHAAVRESGTVARRTRNYRLRRLCTGGDPLRIAGLATARIGLRRQGLLVEWVRSVCDEDAALPSVAIERVVTVPATELEPARDLTPEQVSRHREGNPQALRRRLQGDLDAIALKALRKDPGSATARWTRWPRISAGTWTAVRYWRGRIPPGMWLGSFFERHKFEHSQPALLLLSVGAGLASIALGGTS